MPRQSRTVASLLALSLLLVLVPFGSPARAEQAGARVYQVMLTNLSPNQPLSPPILVTHDDGIQIFAIGEKASDGIQAIAEYGNNKILAEALSASSGVDDVVATDMPLHRVGGLGSSTMSVTVMSRAGADRLSIASMLACTNDGFVGFDSIRLSPTFTPVTLYATSYDAGTEENTQLWTHLPGGCNVIGPMPIPADDMNLHDPMADVISVHGGIITGRGDLGAAFAWSDPTLMITVQRVE
ncbi:MAG: spondin domain-containing protein [Chloroflexota bacterium]